MTSLASRIVLGLLFAGILTGCSSETPTTPPATTAPADPALTPANTPAKSNDPVSSDRPPMPK